MYKAKEARMKILRVSYKAGACHIGSALSCVEILEEIYRKKKKKDVFIFAKASGVAALYCRLFSEDKAVEYLKNYPLPSKEVPGILHSFGSVGHGLPVAVGLALGNRKRDVYVLLSDGDIQEGTMWESILFARQHKLKNLKIYVDRNMFQGCGRTEEILGIEKALVVLNMLFPLNVRKTKKGQGVEGFEGKAESHYKNLDYDGLTKALLQLSR